jgi:hypothetical protein
MKFLTVIILLSIFGDLSLRAIDFDVSGISSKYNESSKHLTVSTNDVVLIKTTSGAVAVIQFTSFSAFTNSGPLTASYRWRFRLTPSQAISSGTGEVRESYDRTPSADGKGYDVSPKVDNNTKVKAGDIKIEWSYGTESSGYLYYYASRAEIKILDSEAFNKDL